MRKLPFVVEDLTINDGDLGLGETKQFDITMGCDWAKLRSLKLVQLKDGPMNITLEIWEKDSSGYDPANRDHYYLKPFRRTVVQTPEQGGEYSEIMEPELLFFDRDKTGEVHCLLTNHDGGTSSDFAITMKMAEVGEKM